MAKLESMKAENPQFAAAPAPAPAPAPVAAAAPKIERRQTLKLKKEFEDDGFAQNVDTHPGLLDLEEKYHDPNDVPSMSVIMKEIEFTDGQIQQYQNSPDELDFFNFKKETLEFAQQTLQTNFETGILTPQKYLEDIKAYLQTQKQLLKQCTEENGNSDEHTKRLKERCIVIADEIKELMDDMKQEQEQA